MAIYDFERCALFFVYVFCSTVFLYLIFSGIVTLLRSASLDWLIHEAKLEKHIVRARVSKVKESGGGFKVVYHYRVGKRSYDRTLMCDDCPRRGSVQTLYFRKDPGSAEFDWSLHFLDRYERICLKCWCFVFSLLFFCFFCYPELLPLVL